MKRSNRLVLRHDRDRVRQERAGPVTIAALRCRIDDADDGSRDHRERESVSLHLGIGEETRDGSAEDGGGQTRWTQVVGLGGSDILGDIAESFVGEEFLEKELRSAGKFCSPVVEKSGTVVETGKNASSYRRRVTWKAVSTVSPGVNGSSRRLSSGSLRVGLRRPCPGIE